MRFNPHFECYFINNSTPVWVSLVLNSHLCLKLKWPQHQRHLLTTFHNWFHLQADKEDPVSMGDPKKELGEDDFDKFDAKKSEAMGVFSEGNIFFFYLPKYHPIYIAL